MGGIFGVISKTDCVNEVFYGTDYLSHLGTKRGGMAVKGANGFVRSIHNLENAYFRSKFEPDLNKFDGQAGIGCISDTDEQPLIIGSHLGQFGIVTVGKIANKDELLQAAFANRQTFSEMSGSEINQTELIARLISNEESFAVGLHKAQELIKGSCTTLLLTESGLYVARDRLGRTPIVIGKREGAFAASSESSAFPNLGFEVDRYLGPNEIVLLSAEGANQIQAPAEKMQVCSFLWVYYGYPASNFEDINVEEVRYRCGQALAAHDDVKVDFASGIPDSGVGHAIGYANSRKIPYRRAFVKYTPTWPRSFMPQNQHVRDLVARMKLIPNKALIENRAICFCEDSIVRGTQLQNNVQILFDYGATEVHMRTACPVLIHPCEFLNFSTSRSTLDLAGRKAIKALEGKEDNNLSEYASSGSERNLAMIEFIRKRLGLTTLKFQILDDLIEAIGLPKEKLCTHCWDGSSHY